MTVKRFQIFGSSTFEDRKDERKTIQEAILRLDHFPAGMEGLVEERRSCLGRSVLETW